MKLRLPLQSRPSDEDIRAAKIRILRKFEELEESCFSGPDAQILAYSLLPDPPRKETHTVWLLRALSLDKSREILSRARVESPQMGVTLAYATDGKLLHVLEIGKDHKWFGKTGFASRNRQLLLDRDITDELVAKEKLPYRPHEDRKGFPNIVRVTDFDPVHKVNVPVETWEYDFRTDKFILPCTDGTDEWTTSPPLPYPISVEAEPMLKALGDQTRLTIEYDPRADMVRVCTYGTMRSAYLKATPHKE